MTDPPERRFADALAKARGEWAAADAAACAARAGGELSAAGVLVPLFGRPHLVTHPDGAVTAVRAGEAAAAPGEPVHVAVAVLLLHYLLTADGAAPTGEWKAYRELPDGLFYATSFAGRAEKPLAGAFAGSPAGLDAFRSAASRCRRRRAHAGRRVVPLRGAAAGGRRRARVGRRRRGARRGPRALRRQREPLPRRPRTSPASAASSPTG